MGRVRSAVTVIEAEMDGRRTTRRTLAIIAGLPFLLVVLAGCGKGKEPPAARPTVAAPRGAATLFLVPEVPDVRGTIRLKYRGSVSGDGVRRESVRWFINGTEYRTEEPAALPGKMIRKGDAVKARAEVALGGAWSVADSNEVTVRNSPPDVVSVDLSDLAPRKGMEVRAVASGRDADGDPVSFRYRWFLNDAEAPGETSNALSLGKVPKGTWVHAEVQGSDGEAAGPARLTPKVRVANTPPRMEEVTITRGAGGLYTANVRVRDADGDAVSIRAKSLPAGVMLAGNALSWAESALPPGTEGSAVLLLSDGDGGDVEYALRLANEQK